MDNERVEHQEDLLASQLAQQVRILRHNMPATQEILDLQAKNVRHFFVSLKNVGFDDEQAMRIVLTKNW